MSKKKSNSTRLTNAILILLILSIIGLYHHQGPEKVIKTWQYTFNQVLQNLNLTRDNTSTAEDSNITPNKPTPKTLDSVREGKAIIFSKANETTTEPKVAIQKQVQTEKHIFTWKDAKGDLHYTDAPPQSPGATLINKKKKITFKKPFKPIIETIDYKLPPDTHRKVELATLKIYQIYDDTLKIKSTESLALKIKIFGDRNEFDAYRKLKAPRLENATGFYSGADKEAALWRHDTPEQLLSVLTHEASHAILDFKIGFAPAWIQEGFAEYFDSMEIYGQTIEIPLDKRWHNQLLTAKKKKNLPNIASFIAMPNEDFYTGQEASTLNYAMAWSLIYFWMEQKQGQRLLHDLLYQWKHSTYGNPNEKVLNPYYPSGLQTLQQEWSIWIKRPRLSHRY